MTIGQWIDPETGNTLSNRTVIENASKSSAVLLGEKHDEAAQHRWQLHVAAGLLARHDNIAMGFEMFPARLDPVLAEWVNGDLSEEAFLEKAEWGTVWGFPPELYLPLFRFCRQFRIPMHGLNCRRSLVTEVGKLGWENISEADRDGLTPAAPATPEFRKWIFGFMGGNLPMAGALTGPEDPKLDRFCRAQQTWDRSFACRIADIRKQDNPPLVIGIIGRGHLEFGHGTPYQLADLGVEDVTILLPQTGEETPPAGIANAVFGMDPGEAAPARDTEAA